MKKLPFVFLSVIICIQLIGCSGWAVRTSSSRKPRVDQEVSGNQGFIAGKPTAPPKEPAFTDRKVYKIEVEIPDLPRKKKTAPTKKESTVRPPKEDKVAWGNKGYFVGGQRQQPAVVQEELQAETAAVEETPEIFEPEAKETAPRRTYKVQKGETLQKISRKFYGTTKKWPLLYKANKDKLKSPDKVFPGQVLVIPGETEFKK